MCFGYSIYVGINGLHLPCRSVIIGILEVTGLFLGGEDLAAEIGNMGPVIAVKGNGIVAAGIICDD